MKFCFFLGGGSPYILAMAMLQTLTINMCVTLNITHIVCVLHGALLIH